MEVTQGIPDGGSLSAINGNWVLTQDSATGRFSRRFTFALPTGGLAESLYTLAVLPGQRLPSLVRRFRTPIGGEGSLLDPDLAERRDRLLQDAIVLADQVLYFGVSCWAPGT